MRAGDMGYGATDCNACSVMNRSVDRGFLDAVMLFFDSFFRQVGGSNAQIQ